MTDAEADTAAAYKVVEVLKKVFETASLQTGVVVGLLFALLAFFAIGAVSRSRSYRRQVASPTRDCNGAAGREGAF